jgi:hypothetical protein
MVPFVHMVVAWLVFPLFVASFVPFSWYDYQIQALSQRNINSSTISSCHEFKAA